MDVRDEMRALAGLMIGSVSEEEAILLRLLLALARFNRRATNGAGLPPDDPAWPTIRRWVGVDAGSPETRSELTSTGYRVLLSWVSGIQEGEVLDRKTEEMLRETGHASRN